MGIRYYAYAFDPELTSRAIADPFSMLASDPLADAWGLEPHAAVSVTSFEQAVPKRDLLYLDKAWRALQALTGAAPGDRPTGAAFRMFEGDVTMRGLGWLPWARAIRPEEVPAIRDQLCAIRDVEVQAWVRGRPGLFAPDDEASYVLHHLHRAQEFVASLAADGRGMVYMIG